MSLLHVGGSSGTSVVPAEGVDFDGVNDYLSRSSDLVGNVDSKAFTFSCWVYTGDYSSTKYVFASVSAALNNFGVLFVINNNGTLQIQSTNSVGTAIFSVISSIILPKNTFVNFLISIDLANIANRYLYINDKLDVSTNWQTYINDTINMTQDKYYIANVVGVGGVFKGRLSNIFLDYTFRDLSIEANRRLFITADGKPTPTATLSALNPILYLPLKDSATATQNLGTGGNFTLNGTIATSNRGANQDNCVASTFDGVADYLSRASLTGVADGKQFTLSFTINTKIPAGSKYPLFFSTGAGACVIVQYDGAGTVSISAYSLALSTIFNVSVNVNTLNTTNNVVVSADVSDINKRFIVINGMVKVATWSPYNNMSIPFSSINSADIARRLTTYFNGNIGELYFDTIYTPLDIYNPFWIED